MAKFTLLFMLFINLGYNICKNHSMFIFQMYENFRLSLQQKNKTEDLIKQKMLEKFKVLSQRQLFIKDKKNKLPK